MNILALKDGLLDYSLGMDSIFLVDCYLSNQFKDMMDIRIVVSSI